jgi:hypothetical protein
LQLQLQLLPLLHGLLHWILLTVSQQLQLTLGCL